ncbi:MAG: ABC transporter substrate-binding protein [Bacteriovoracaceae bacterium]
MKLALIPLLLIILFVPARAEVVNVGIASNFSELSTVTFNPFGGYFKDAIHLAVKQRENDLKKNGIDLIVKEFDYGADDSKVAEVAKNTVASDVSVVVGYNYSSSALIAAPIHVEAKLPMISPSASANRLGTFGSYVHLGSFDNQFMAQSLARLAKEKLKFQKALIVSAVDCAYCVDLSNSFEKQFSSMGGEVVKKMPVLQDDKEFSGIIAQIREIEFDFVFIPNQELTSARIISAFVNQGYTKPFLGADGWGNEGKEFFSVLKGKKFVGYSVTHWHPKLDTAKSKSFVNAYLKNFKKLPNDTSVLAFDSMNLLIDTIINNRDRSRAGLESALKKMTSFKGVTGNYSLRPHMAPQKDILILTTKNDQFVIDRVLKLGSE